MTKQRMTMYSLVIALAAAGCKTGGRTDDEPRDEVAGQQAERASKKEDKTSLSARNARGEGEREFVDENPDAVAGEDELRENDSLWDPNAKLELSTGVEEPDLSGEDSSDMVVDFGASSVIDCTDNPECAQGQGATLLQVIVNAKDASVMIDDIYVGDAGEKLDVQPGRFKMEVIAPGFKTHTQTITIEPGEAKVIRVQLKATKKGDVEIRY